MRRILVINGPNLNLLGVREPQIYGTQTYRSLCDMLRGHAERRGVGIGFFQSNHEGALVDAVQDALGVYDGEAIGLRLALGQPAQGEEPPCV